MEKNHKFNMFASSDCHPSNQNHPPVINIQVRYLGVRGKEKSLLTVNPLLKYSTVSYIMADEVRVDSSYVSSTSSTSGLASARISAYHISSPLHKAFESQDHSFSHTVSYAFLLLIIHSPHHNNDSARPSPCCNHGPIRRSDVSTDRSVI